jgi:uncharacterized protein (TIGR03437 family)
LTNDPNAGTKVFFSGIPAKIVYTSAKQIAAFVPELFIGTAQVTVSYHGQVSDAISVPMGPSAPGLFTLNQTVAGQTAPQPGTNRAGASRLLRAGWL